MGGDEMPVDGWGEGWWGGKLMGSLDIEERECSTTDAWRG